MLKSVFFLLIIMTVSCQNYDNSSVKFFKNYSNPDLSGLERFDTLKTDIKQLANEFYYAEKIISDSISYIFLIKNNRRYFYGTNGCQITKRVINPNSIMYYRKTTEYSQSNEKTALDISAYYLNDTVNLVISETLKCVPIGGDNDSNQRPMSAYLLITGKNKTSSSFCVYPIDTINIIENFTTYEKFKLFVKKLRNYPNGAEMRTLPP
jgi:hypothetical protein